WKTAQPILRQWMRERMSLRSIFKRVRAQLPELAESAKTLPQLVHGMIQQAAEGRFRLQVESAGIEELKLVVRETNAKRNAVTVATALLLGGILWIALVEEPLWPGALLSLGGAGWLFGAWRR